MQTSHEAINVICILVLTFLRTNQFRLTYILLESFFRTEYFPLQCEKYRRKWWNVKIKNALTVWLFRYFMRLQFWSHNCINFIYLMVVVAWILWSCNHQNWLASLSTVGRQQHSKWKSQYQTVKHISQLLSSCHSHPFCTNNAFQQTSTEFSGDFKCEKSTVS